MFLVAQLPPKRRERFTFKSRHNYEERVNDIYRSASPPMCENHIHIGFDGYGGGEAPLLLVKETVFRIQGAGVPGEGNASTRSELRRDAPQVPE